MATVGALEALERNETTGIEFLKRHLAGDWGMVCDEDKESNDEALRTGARILSAYFLPDETTLWIITEAADATGKRPATTLLLPEEY